MKLTEKQIKKLRVAGYGVELVGGDPGDSEHAITELWLIAKVPTDKEDEWDAGDFHVPIRARAAVSEIGFDEIEVQEAHLVDFDFDLRQLDDEENALTCEALDATVLATPELVEFLLGCHEQLAKNTRTHTCERCQYTSHRTTTEGLCDRCFFEGDDEFERVDIER